MDLTYENNCIQNEEELFKRMNGSIPSSDEKTREAIEAYNNMPFHKDDFSYDNNYNITLCPAPQQNGIYPAPNSSVASNVNSGYIKLDTWCDATKDISNAISLSGAVFF